MKTLIQPADLQFFSILGGAGSLSAAARELSISTAAVSKHLAQIEERLGLPLVTRTTRRMSLTPEGKLYLEQARRILADIGDLEHRLRTSKEVPRGQLRVNATLGFGRSHVAPLISKFVLKNPEVDVQLQLSVNPPPLTDGAYDVCIRFGQPPDARVVALHLAQNRRILCASPHYLARRGVPSSPSDLLQHNCIGIRQGKEAYGLWRLSSQHADQEIEQQAVKTRGNLATNDGEIAVRWALDGHGILLRAEWDVQRYLSSGRLVQVLAEYVTPNADIYLVYPESQRGSTRVRAFTEFACAYFGTQQIN